MDHNADYIGALLRYYDLLELHKQEIKAAKEALMESAKIAFSEADLDTRRGIVGFLYYECTDVLTGDDAGSLVGLKSSLVSSFTGAYITETKCGRCGTPITITVKSRYKLQEAKRCKSDNRCDSCAQDALNKRSNASVEIQQQADDYAAYVAHLRAMPYPEYLKTTHWQELRSKKIKQAGFRCQVCNTPKVTLHVHHRTYENRGQEDMRDLIVLCAVCHQTFHDNGRVQS